MVKERILGHAVLINKLLCLLLGPELLVTAAGETLDLILRMPAMVRFRCQYEDQI
jgi:hypothetical protein